MSIREHRAAVRSAQRTGRELKTAFHRLGTHAHPRGVVFAAYIQARRALVGNMDDRLIVVEVMAELRHSIRRGLETQFTTAAALGAEQALRDAQNYRLTVTPRPAVITPAVQATMAAYTVQEAAVLSGLFDEAALLGDARRVGLLTPGAVTREGSRWLTSLAVAAWLQTIKTEIEPEPDPDDNEFVKQLVAGIDERTTETCIFAHGQWQPLDGLYQLTGTPRYADEMESTPFHDWCRSVSALVLRRDVEDDLTRDMRKAADMEYKARQRDDYTEPRLANALTGVR